VGDEASGGRRSLGLEGFSEMEAWSGGGLGQLAMELLMGYWLLG
jgi:hypothetical protein